jgi:hypothetical protein
VNATREVETPRVALEMLRTEVTTIPENKVAERIKAVSEWYNTTLAETVLERFHSNILRSSRGLSEETLS